MNQSILDIKALTGEKLVIVAPLVSPRRGETALGANACAV